MDCHWLYDRTLLSLALWPYLIVTGCMTVPYCHWLYDRTLLSLAVWPYLIVTGCMTVPYCHWLYDRTLLSLAVWPYLIVTGSMTVPYFNSPQLGVHNVHQRHIINWNQHKSFLNWNAMYAYLFCNWVFVGILKCHPNICNKLLIILWFVDSWGTTVFVSDNIYTGTYTYN